MGNEFALFEQRKKDHIQFALMNETEAKGGSGLDTISLTHEALPDFNFDDITINTKQLGHPVQTPFLVSSMTAGHEDASTINQRLMEACSQTGWAMGIGSQRRELNDKQAHKEWSTIRKRFPTLRLYGNIGISQLATSTLDDIKRLVGNIEAQGMQIHLNALQECIQAEGTPLFKGALKSIETLSHHLAVPVIIKETGCGFSRNTLLRLNNTGVKAVDISGYGGTHWGRIEGLRNPNEIQQTTAQTFKHWGISTLSSMKNAASCSLDYEIWASGGVRTGLHAAKLIALGAQTIGFAKPMLESALKGTESIIEIMSRIEYELKVALFCTGHTTLKALKEDQHAII